jgi:hypothetical protein
MTKPGGQLDGDWWLTGVLLIITLALFWIVGSQIWAEAQRSKPENWEVVCNGIGGCGGAATTLLPVGFIAATMAVGIVVVMSYAGRVNSS